MRSLIFHKNKAEYTAELHYCHDGPTEVSVKKISDEK